jgi:hypothetical protein
MLGYMPFGETEILERHLELLEADAIVVTAHATAGGLLFEIMIYHLVDERKCEVTGRAGLWTYGWRGLAVPVRQLNGKPMPASWVVHDVIIAVVIKSLLLYIYNVYCSTVARNKIPRMQPVSIPCRRRR